MATDIEIADARITRYVWRHIGKKTAREMAEELNVAPEDILRIKRDLVESVDDITLQVQKMKLLSALQELADDAQERSRNVTDERNYSGMINASVGAIKALLTELNRTSRADSEAVSILNQMRVRELFSLMQEVVDSGVREIAKDNNLNVQELFEVFNRKLSEASARRDSM